MKVRIFQIQRHEPVPWAYLREDLFHGLLAGLSSGNKTRAPPLSAWLFRRISEVSDPRRSLAGVLGASGRGSIVLSVSALYLIDPQVKSSQVELYCHSTTCVDI